VPKRINAQIERHKLHTSHLRLDAWRAKILQGAYRYLGVKVESSKRGLQPNTLAWTHRIEDDNCVDQNKDVVLIKRRDIEAVAVSRDVFRWHGQRQCRHRHRFGAVCRGQRAVPLARYVPTGCGVKQLSSPLGSLGHARPSQQAPQRLGGRVLGQVQELQVRDENIFVSQLIGFQGRCCQVVSN
jgi:hypothetical protein